MDSFNSIKFDKSDTTAWIELNRPGEANGLNAQMATELRRAAELCAADQALKAVVLRASGRFFCAGGDLKEVSANGDKARDAIKALADDLHAAISILSRMQALLIVAVNGVAAGGGFSLALIGDVVLAASSAKFTMAYTRSGLSPDGSSSYFLPRLVGLRKAQELMLLNPTLSADEARDVGLVTRVIADDELWAEADAIAVNFANGARQSTACVKKLLLASSLNDLETQMDLEAELIKKCVSSRDGREGIQAFVEKRKPEFE